MHHDLGILNANKDRLEIERLPFNEVVKQVLRLCKGPVAEHISRHRRDRLGPERPRTASREEQDKSNLATLLKDCHKFLVRRSAIIKKQQQFTVCLLMYRLYTCTVKYLYI